MTECLDLISIRMRWNCPCLFSLCICFKTSGSSYYPLNNMSEALEISSTITYCILNLKVCQNSSWVGGGWGWNSQLQSRQASPWPPWPGRKIGRTDPFQPASLDLLPLVGGVYCVLAVFSKNWAFGYDDRGNHSCRRASCHRHHGSWCGGEALYVHVCVLLSDRIQDRAVVRRN